MRWYNIQKTVFSLTPLTKLSSPLAGVGRLVNAKGVPVYANAASFQSAASDFLNSFDSNNYVDLVNGPSITSYPISTYEYYAIRSTSIVDCQKGTRFMNYLIWTQTGSDAVRQTFPCVPENPNFCLY